MPETETKAQQVIKRQGELEKIRDPFVDLWKECTALGYPARNDWEDTAQTGRSKEYEIYDDTCMKALNIRANGIYGHHISPALKWFASRSPDKELQELDEIRLWLQESDEGMYDAYARSNFYDASCIGSFLRDGDGIGLATMFIEEIIGSGKIGFMVPHPREVWVAEDKFGNPNLMHRKLKWTMLQIEESLSESEIKKLSFGVRENIKNHKQITAKAEFIWAVWPNPNYIKGSLVQGRRKFNTYLVQVDGTNLIRTGSLDIFPPVWRVKKPSNLPYGRGLIGEALISVYVTNEMSKSMLGAAQYGAEGLWMIPAGKRAEADIAPGGRNYYRDSNDEIRQVKMQIQYPFGAEERKQVQQAVMDNFQVDYFIALSRAAQENANLRELHVMEIKGEKVALMGPDLGTLNTILDRIHDKVFDIEMKAGRLPPLPQVLLDKIMEDERRQPGRISKASVIDIDYLGPLVQDQKRLFKTQGITHSLQALEPLVELQVAAQVPVTVLDRLDEDEAVEEIFDAHGMPQKLMRDDDAVAEIRRIREEKAAAREAAAMAVEAAKAVPSLQKETKSTSPLAKIAEAV